MIKRVLGTETEFGIASRDADAADPVSNSLFLINHYPSFPSPRCLWDYEN
jgi:proteasome accessory factor A